MDRVASDDAERGCYSRCNAIIIEEKFTTKIDGEVNVGRGLEADRSINAIAVRIIE